MVIVGVKAANKLVAARNTDVSINAKANTKAVVEPNTAATDNKAEKPKRRRKADK